MATLIKILDNAKFLSKTVLGEVSSPAPQPPTYAIGRSLSAVNEGSSVTFTLSTTNVANGTLVPYTISGISSTDVTTGSLTGSFTVSNGLATATITMSADQLTEGAETATLTLNNAAASNFVVVNDTSVFTPATISGLQLWLDAADSSTLFDATAGGSLVTADGAAVARWADKSGNNRHATQATVNARPVLRTNIQNAKSSIRFDGGNDRVSLSATPLLSSGNTNLTFVAVYRPMATTTTYGHLFGNYSSGNLAIYQGNLAPYLTPWGVYNGTSIDSDPGQYASNVPLSIMTVRNSGQWVNFTNGVQKNTVANAQSVYQGATFPTTWFIGGASYGDFSNIHLHELLVYNAALTTAQRQAVETYLNSKWAIYQ